MLLECQFVRNKQQKIYSLTDKKSIRIKHQIMGQDGGFFDEESHVFFAKLPNLRHLKKMIHERLMMRVDSCSVFEHLQFFG